MKKNILLLFVSALAVLLMPAAAKPEVAVPPLTFDSYKKAPEKARASVHPRVIFLDKNGGKVTETKSALSLMRTCGQCHDTAFISRKNYHALAGFDEMSPAGKTPSGRPWDTGTGLFGRWEPLTYRTLSTLYDSSPDLTTADWIRTAGARHVGGGPAMFSRVDGLPLDANRQKNVRNNENLAHDPKTGKLADWDWDKSGTVEVNCLLCHVKSPNNTERVRTLRAGKFRWASTATLAGEGLVKKTSDGWEWNKAAFGADGAPDISSFEISDPDSSNCRICHGRACKCTDPVVFKNSLDNWSVETSGEIFSPSRISASGMNIENKEKLDIPWDVHAERLVDCSSCHYSPNNPAYINKTAGGRTPAHLQFDSRRSSINDYLISPDHNFVKGHTAQGTADRRLDGSMRNCRDCHDAEKTHDFLPYKKLHFNNISCQTCHIPVVRAPLRRTTDWTLPTFGLAPRVQHRGIDGPVNEASSLIYGYRPALLLHEDDGRYRLGPYNIITTWFWTEGAPEKPVPLETLREALFTPQGDFRPEVVNALDTNGDGKISPSERKLDSEKKISAVAALLKKAGVKSPRIRAEIQPYTLSHGIAPGSEAIRDCKLCHSGKSRINKEIVLSSYSIPGVSPKLMPDSITLIKGNMAVTKNHALTIVQRIDPAVLYIHGTDRTRWTDIIGLLAVAGSLFGVAAHALLRIISARRRGKG
ncbi:MAG: hypothetical protein WCX65_10790 [bacterium]